MRRSYIAQMDMDGEKLVKEALKNSVDLPELKNPARNADKIVVCKCLLA